MPLQETVNLSDYWMSHSHCVLYDTVTIALHVLGDALTALAYMVIPVGLVATSWRYRMAYTKELRTLLLHGAAFIVLCGWTHFMSIWNWWNTNYTASGMVVLACGLVSITFAIRFWFYLTKHPLKTDTSLSTEEWYGTKSD